MRLWLMSDVHLELTKGWDLPPPAQRPDFDVFVMAGDLVPRMERGVRWLAERVDKPVVYVPGNHEFYGTDEARTVEKAMQAAAGTNVHVLQNRSVTLEDRAGSVTFAGATTWSDFQLHGDQRRAMVVAADRMNDFRKIRTDGYRRRFRPSDALLRHQQSLAFLEAEMRKPRGEGQRLVAVTHHSPVRAWRRSGEDDSLEPAFRSDLTWLMRPQPAEEGKGALRPAELWCFGHTHESYDARVGDTGVAGTRVVANCKGYGPWPPAEPTWDNPDFDPHLVIKV